MKKLILPFLSLIVMISSTSAAPIVSYSFTEPPYTFGTDLAGQQSWTGATGYVADNIIISSTGLTNPGMQGETGGAIMGIANFSEGNSSVLLGPNTSTATETGAGERWFAALLSLTHNGGSDQNFVRLNIDTQTDPSATGFVFGLVGEGAIGTYTFRTGLNTGASATTTGFTGTQYVGGTTALVVGRVTVTSTGGGTPELLEFWLNPTDATSVTTLTNTAQGMVSRNDLSVVFGNWGGVSVGADMLGSGPGNYMQDEIRVGTALSDLNLTAIPEPSTWALLSLSLTAAIALHRRRRRKP